MIKHIVCFKLKDPTPEACEKCREVLLSMKGNVPTLRGIEVGIDFMRSARSCDVVLLVDVERTGTPSPSTTMTSTTARS